MFIVYVWRLRANYLAVELCTWHDAGRTRVDVGAISQGLTASVARVCSPFVLTTSVE